MDLLSRDNTLEEGTSAGDNESLHFAKQRNRELAIMKLNSYDSIHLPLFEYSHQMFSKQGFLIH
jgi:hypothetical protein